VIPSAAPSTGAGALLERNAELSMLAESLEAVERSARGRVLLVGGEAGVGKTTLLRRFLEERGRSALACDSLRGLGYERLAHLDGGLKAWKEAGRPTQPRP
jgi:Cdc6-like AAA superfamily ATPase